jgi:hypothetical protein
MNDPNSDKSGWEFSAYVVLAVAFFLFAMLNRFHATH